MPDTHRHPAAGGAGEPSHLSIGEVLGLLLEEFPDVTISKIRFLESQGLIAPERTPSGYRKFFDEDVELLRVILREQRENYLPLRVIKDRISSGEIDPSGENTIPRGIRNVSTADDRDRDRDHGAGGAQPGSPDREPSHEPAKPTPTADRVDADPHVGANDAAARGEADDSQPAGVRRPPADRATSRRPDPDAATPDDDPMRTPAPPSASEAEHNRRSEPSEALERSAMDTAPVPTVGQSERSSADPVSDPPRSAPPPAGHDEAPDPADRPESPHQQAPHRSGDHPATVSVGSPPERERPPASSSSAERLTSPQLLPGVTLTVDELCAMIAATDAELQQLEEYGIVQGRDSAGERVYDEDAVAVARVAVQFLRLGVDARHLRGWKTAADREAGIYEQLITPLLRQRNPQGRQQANERLQQMDELGAELRAALMRVALRDLGRPH